MSQEKIKNISADTKTDKKANRVTDIIFSDKMGREFLPMDLITLQLEEKIRGLEISHDQRIQGVTPIGNTSALNLPPNSGFKTIVGKTFIIAPNGEHSIEVIDLVNGHKLNKLSK